MNDQNQPRRRNIVDTFYSGISSFEYQRFLYRYNIAMGLGMVGLGIHNKFVNPILTVEGLGIPIETQTSIGSSVLAVSGIASILMSLLIKGDRSFQAEEKKRKIETEFIDITSHLKDIE